MSRILTTWGGNDIGFADIAKACALARVTGCRSNYPVGPDGLDSIDRSILGLQGQLRQLYTALSSATSGDVIVVTYPIILPSFLASGNLGTCQFSPVKADDVPWLTNKQTELNQVIRNAVAAAPANVKLLNEESAFAGHELCTHDPWFNNVDIWLFVTDYSKSKGCGSS